MNSIGTISSSDVAEALSGLDARQMDILRDAMQEYASVPTDMSPLRLQSVAPTDKIEAQLAAFDLALLSAEGRAAIRIEGQIKETERQLQLAIERDKLAATRPEGCWCLGAGGRQRRYVPIPQGYDDERSASIVEPVEVFREHCGHCPEGEARLLSDEKLWDDYRSDYRRRRVARIIRQSGLEALDEYRDYVWRNHPDRRVVQRMADWLDMPGDRPWLLIVGPPGRGKTSQAAGLGFEIAKRGRGVMFRTVPDLLTDLKGGFDDDAKETEGALIDAFKNVDTLILDDIGAEKPTGYAGEKLTQILNHRHNAKLRTILTSNLFPSGEKDDPSKPSLADHLGGRLWGRIKRMALPVYMEGDDLRDTVA